MDTSFEQRLVLAARRIEPRLGLWLGSHAPDVPPRLREAMEHAVLGGGKRFRPFLVIETAALFGVAEAAALDVAAALECLHCYSLVHDDLPAMDNDTLRRGLPTVWAAFDDWTAILAGDALLTLSFEILGSLAPPVESDTIAMLVRRLAIEAGRQGMVGGQMLDLEAEKRRQPENPSLEHIRHLQAMKTGALIHFACEAGAILGRADRADQAALSSFGRALGLAFQLSDDLLDAEGDAVAVGKAVGKDTALGKATVVAHQGIAAAQSELAHTVDAALASLARFDARADALRDAARFMLHRDR